MVDILHRVGVKSPSTDDVYAALTSVDKLASWWTNETKGAADAGGVLEFRFPAGGFDMKVVDLQPGKRVLWEVIGGPDEWVGTEIVWDLKREDDYTVILFKHQGWREPVEFMHHCSTKWATYLMSLKELVETGTGAPSPHDVRIDNWG
ncbi:SRPBCC domain-containing protein [Nocardia sp. NPDC060256]|uniref:SRPBCC family protein n=1 Tax=unclassified Nocardia TaxID=2637762 RepID=UPI0036646C21